MSNQAENEKLDQAESAPAEDASAAQSETDIDALNAKVEENWNLYLRAAAELDNVRKRAARDVEHARKYALENFSRDLLSVVDSFQMGLAAAENADAQTLKEGSEATLKQLMTALERLEPNSVLAVVQSGYTLNGRLLRPARVIVSTAVSET